MQPSPSNDVSTEQLESELASATPPLVAEILGPEQYASGHLPGAVNLPLQGLVENALRVLPDKGARIVVYCASETCQNSDLARRKLLGLGYADVRVFKGGKAAWRETGRVLAAG